MRDTNFRTIWYVEILVELSRRLEFVVLGILIYETTKSPFQLALLLVFNYAPKPLIAPFCGILADRFSRHRILLVAQGLNLGAAAAVFSLIIAGSLEPWHIYIATALQGMSWAIQEPARRTAIFDMIGPERIVNAISLEQVSSTAGKLAGPLLGGVLVWLAGYDWAYGVGVAFHAVALGMLLFLKIPDVVRAASPEPVLRGLAEVTRYTLRTPMLVGTMYMILLMNGFAFPVEQFVPAIGKDQLKVGPALVGLLVSSLAMGQISAAAIAFMGVHHHHGRVLMLGCAVIFVMGLLLAWSPWYALAFAVFLIGGVGMASFSTMQGTITLLWAPPEMRGRMQGLRSLCIGLGTPLGALQIGLLTMVIGIQWAISASVLFGLLLLLPPLLLSPLVFQRHRGQEPPRTSAEAQGVPILRETPEV